MAQAELKTLGVREFRESLAEHLVSDQPIAITKHGLTLGYYIPTYKGLNQADSQALQEASKQLNDLLNAQSLDSEALIEQSKALRKQSKKTSG